MSKILDQDTPSDRCDHARDGIRRPGLMPGLGFTQLWSLPISGKQMDGQVAVRDDVLVVLRDERVLLVVEPASGQILATHQPCAADPRLRIAHFGFLAARLLRIWLTTADGSELPARGLHHLDLGTGALTRPAADLPSAATPATDRSFRERHPTASYLRLGADRQVAVEPGETHWRVHLADGRGTDLGSWDTPWTLERFDQVVCKPSYGAVYILSATMSLAHHKPLAGELLVCDPQALRALHEPIASVPPWCRLYLRVHQDPARPSRVCWAGGLDHCRDRILAPTDPRTYGRQLYLVDLDTGSVQRHPSLLHGINAIGPGWVAGFATYEAAGTGWFEVVDLDCGTCHVIPSGFSNCELRGILTRQRLFVIRRHRRLEAWHWVAPDEPHPSVPAPLPAGSWAQMPEPVRPKRRKAEDPPPVAALVPAVVDDAERFVWAVAAGSLDTAQARYRGPAMLDHASPKFGTALACAAQRGHLELLRWLVTLRPPRPAPTPAEDALALAIDAGHATTALLLRQHGQQLHPHSRIWESRLRKVCAAVPELEPLIAVTEASGRLWLDLTPQRYLREAPPDHPSRRGGPPLLAALTALGWFAGTTARYQSFVSSLLATDGSQFCGMHGGYLQQEAVHPEIRRYRSLLDSDGIKPLPFCAGPTRISERWREQPETDTEEVSVAFSLAKTDWTVSFVHRAPFVSPEFLATLQQALATVDPAARLAIVQDNGRHGLLIVHREATLLAARSRGILPVDLIRRDGTGIESD